MIYLDNGSTTKIDPAVVEAMLPYLNEEYGNPSSKFYTLAVNAKKAIDESRLQVATLVGANRDEIIFTSGAAEGNNFIIKGVTDSYSDKGNHIITSVVEHKSILDACKYLEEYRGFQVTYLPVNATGQVSPDDLERSIRDDTILVSLMWGNNEVGTLNPVNQLGQICKAHKVLFHSDATQVIGKLRVDMAQTAVDFITFSAHKIHGPKGVGAVYVRKDELGIRRRITPLIHGGQEYGYRGGTHPVHNIVGFGKAAEIARLSHGKNVTKLQELDCFLRSSIKEAIPDVTFNGHPEERIPGVVNLTIPGIKSELVVRMLAGEFALSTGSACSLSKPSHVLQAMGKTIADVKCSFRVVLSRYTKREDITKFVQAFKNIVETYRI